MTICPDFYVAYTKTLMRDNDSKVMTPNDIRYKAMIPAATSSNATSNETAATAQQMFLRITFDAKEIIKEVKYTTQDVLISSEEGEARHHMFYPEVNGKKSSDLSKY